MLERKMGLQIFIAVLVLFIPCSDMFKLSRPELIRLSYRLFGQDRQRQKSNSNSFDRSTENSGPPRATSGEKQWKSGKIFTQQQSRRQNVIASFLSKYSWFILALISRTRGGCVRRKIITQEYYLNIDRKSFTPIPFLSKLISAWFNFGFIF